MPPRAFLPGGRERWESGWREGPNHSNYSNQSSVRIIGIRRFLYLVVLSTWFSLYLSISLWFLKGFQDILLNFTRGCRFLHTFVKSFDVAFHRISSKVQRCSKDFLMFFFFVKWNGNLHRRKIQFSILLPCTFEFSNRKREFIKRTRENGHWKQGMRNRTVGVSNRWFESY